MTSKNDFGMICFSSFCWSRRSCRHRWSRRSCCRHWRRRSSRRRPCTRSSRCCRRFDQGLSLINKQGAFQRLVFFDQHDEKQTHHPLFLGQLNIYKFKNYPTSRFREFGTKFPSQLKLWLIFQFISFPQPDVDANREAANQGQPDADAGGGPDDAAAIVGPIGPQLFGAAPFPGCRCFSIKVSKNANKD